MNSNIPQQLCVHPAKTITTDLLDVGVQTLCLAKDCRLSMYAHPTDVGLGVLEPKVL